MNDHQNTMIQEHFVDSQQLIEFEQALLVQSNIPNISNPCMRRTMNIGPKKFVGSRENPQLHLHTNRKANFTDFDTFSMLK